MNTIEACEEVVRLKKLVEGTNVSLLDCFIHLDGNSSDVSIDERIKWFIVHPKQYKTAIAIVEDKPVFKGDRLWCKSLDIYITVESCNDVWCNYIEDNKHPGMIPIRFLSWNKPIETIRGKLTIPKPINPTINVLYGSLIYAESPLHKYKWPLPDLKKVEEALINLFNVQESYE
jgi:hypothetical protein